MELAHEDCNQVLFRVDYEGGVFGVVGSTINNPHLIQFALRFTF